MATARFLGEFDVTLDAKGRVMLPALLKKQMPKKTQNRFVINRGFEKHLVLYPFGEWEIISGDVSNLNLYVKDNRDFARYFFRGATELIPDGTGRILLPKSLLDYASIEKDVILFAYINRVEVWNKKLYNRQMDEEPRDFVKLAELVMGKKEEKK